MYLRAGLISLGLLLLSRVLGLARESVQAAAFGTSALADVVVTMMTLPDLASSILAGGALSYALLPWWARQTPAELAASQRRAAQIFMAVGLALGLWIAVVTGLWSGWLAPGAGPGMQGALAAALRWSALAVPISLLSFVWYTRLQHERDAVGMYGMNVVHTAVVIAAMVLAAFWHLADPVQTVAVLGVGLLVAFGLRSAFLQWRLARSACVARALPPIALESPVQGLPPLAIWLWALAATGLPVAVPLVARSLVSHSAPGALASFNYAWKLVELPNLLAVQLVATLAFPALTRAHAQGRDYTVQLCTAFVMAWTLACAGAVGLSVAAQPLAQLLFGWGRMQATQVSAVAQWAALGAWTLLPQALISVCLLVLATTGRLRTGALIYALLIAALALAGLTDGIGMMALLCGLMSLAAAGLLLACGKGVWAALAWRELAVPAVACALLVGAIPRVLASVSGGASLVTLAVGALSSLLVLALSYSLSPTLRAALKR